MATYRRSKELMQEDAEKRARKRRMLTGGQAKLDKNKNNKLDAQDFKILRAEKAKGRGMGLQDEKVKPGKVMKAKRGQALDKKAIEKLAKKKGLPVPLASSTPGELKKGFFKAFGQFPAVDKVKPSAGGKGSGTTNLGNQRKKGDPFLKRRMKLAGLKQLGKVATGRLGAIGAILGASAVGGNMAGRKLEKVLDERKARKRDTAKVKKMVGGLIGKKAGKMLGDKFLKRRLKVGASAGAVGATSFLPNDERKARKRDTAKVKKMGGGMMNKVMKAKRGSGLDLPVIKSIKPEAKKNTTKTNPNKKRFSSMEEMRKAKGFKPGETPAEFNKRKAMLKRSVEAAKATRLGKIIAPIALAGVGAVQYLKSKMKKEESMRDRKKQPLKMKDKMEKNTVMEGSKVAASKVSPRMGGGMMKRPMGYKQGMPVKGLSKGMSEKGDDPRERTRGINKNPRRDFKLKRKMSGGQSKPGPSNGSNITPFLIEKDKKVFVTPKKMGGGMMNKPMGYRSGKSVKVKCKLGRNKPTKMY